MKIFCSLIFAAAFLVPLVPKNSFAEQKKPSVKEVPISHSGSSAKITHKFKRS